MKVLCKNNDGSDFDRKALPLEHMAFVPGSLRTAVQAGLDAPEERDGRGMCPG